MILLYLYILDGNFDAGDQCNANHEGVVENVRILLSNWSIEGFLLGSLIRQFPAGSKVYIVVASLRAIRSP